MEWNWVCLTTTHVLQDILAILHIFGYSLQFICLLQLCGNLDFVACGILRSFSHFHRLVKSGRRIQPPSDIQWSLREVHTQRGKSENLLRRTRHGVLGLCHIRVVCVLLIGCCHSGGRLLGVHGRQYGLWWLCSVQCGVLSWRLLLLSSGAYIYQVVLNWPLGDTGLFRVLPHPTWLASIVLNVWMRYFACEYLLTYQGTKAPSHYLNQCWLPISIIKVQWNSSECNFTWYTWVMDHSN